MFKLPGERSGSLVKSTIVEKSLKIGTTSSDIDYLIIGAGIIGLNIAKSIA